MPPFLTGKGRYVVPPFSRRSGACRACPWLSPEQSGTGREMFPSPLDSLLCFPEAGQTPGAKWAAVRTLGLWVTCRRHNPVPSFAAVVFPRTPTPWWCCCCNGRAAQGPVSCLLVPLCDTNKLFGAPVLTEGSGSYLLVPLASRVWNRWGFLDRFVRKLGLWELGLRKTKQKENRNKPTNQNPTRTGFTLVKS